MQQIEILKPSFQSKPHLCLAHASSSEPGCLLRQHWHCALRARNGVDKLCSFTFACKYWERGAL
eukprot:612409-Pelagomonas_calceolata.AAC.1